MRNPVLSKLAVLFTLTAFALSLSAQEQPKGRRASDEPELTSKPVEIPESEKVDRKSVSIEEAIRAHVTSIPFESGDPRTVGNQDVFEYEMARLKEWSEGTGDYEKWKGAKGRGVLFVRYGFNEEAAEKVLAASKQLDRTVILTEADNAMVGTFKEGEAYNFDFENAKWKNTSQARGIKMLLDSGFIHATPKSPRHADRMIVMDPLNNSNDKERDALMHLKQLIFFVEGPKGQIEIVDFFTGTANGNEGNRINRGLRFASPELGLHAYQHALAVIETFLKGGLIHEIPPSKPIEIQFADGRIRHGYTDGKYDWNMELAEDFRRVERGELKLEQALLSEFVFTNGKVRAAMIAALKADIVRAKAEGREPMKVILAIEGKFAEMRAANLASTLVGIPNIMGGFNPGQPGTFYTFQAPSEVAKHITVYVHQRPVPGRKITNPNGIPDFLHLLHDKTAVLVTATGAIIHSGSFNLSGNYHSAEDRIIIEALRQSWIAKGFISSIREMIKDPKHFLRGEKGFLRMSLANMLGHTWFEISYDPADRSKSQLDLLMDLLGANDWRYEREQKPLMFDLKKAKELLLTIANSETDIAEEHRPDKKTIEKRVNSLIEFIEYYEAVPETEKLFKHLSVEKLVMAAELVSNPQDPPHLRRTAVESIFWAPADKISKEQLEKLMTGAWGKLGYEDTLPPERRRSESESKPGKEASEQKTDVKETKESETKKPAAKRT
ncbi:MAG TPA: hypothetical protein VFV50_03480, partial [Bdellovibrionales bacterium]|nr:hypothetical protein [Bdellovibrionales bacterium]